MRLTALVLVLIWQRISPPPARLGPPKAWQTWAAKAVHHLTYLVFVTIPWAGWVNASAIGLDIMFAHRWVICPIAPVSEAWENASFLAQSVLTKLLMGVLALHVLDALTRAIKGDGTMDPMLGG